MSSLPTPYRLDTIISHPRPLPAGLGGTLNTLVDPIINRPCQGPSSPSQAPRGTPVSPDTATFKRFESWFRHLCAILGKSLSPSLSWRVWPAHHETSSLSAGEAPGSSRPAWGSTGFLPSQVCVPLLADTFPGVPPSAPPPRGFSLPQTSKVTPFQCGLPSAPPPPPELAQGNGVFSPPCQALWEVEGVTGCPTPHRHPGDNRGGGGRCGHQGALLRAVPGHEQEGSALCFGESRGSCWGQGTNGAAGSLGHTSEDTQGHGQRNALSGDMQGPAPQVPWLPTRRSSARFCLEAAAS